MVILDIEFIINLFNMFRELKDRVENFGREMEIINFGDFRILRI